jgi:hypothetical protein
MKQSVLRRISLDCRITICHDQSSPHGQSTRF